MRLHLMELHSINYCFSAGINIGNTIIALFLNTNENK